MDRRSLFETTATLGLGALAGCALRKGGRSIPMAHAPDPVNACALGLDMTRRGLQRGNRDQKTVGNRQKF